MKAAIPDAGFAIRFLQKTKSQPKEMLPAYDKSTLQFLLLNGISLSLNDSVTFPQGKNQQDNPD